MDSLDIADVAKRTGLTARALRFYEARGLVKPLRTANGRRCFGPGELARLTAIASPAMMESVGKMYDGMHNWRDEQKPPFSTEVWAFIKSVGPKSVGPVPAVQG